MKYRILLTLLSLLTLTTTLADTKKKSVLSLKESITDNDIQFPPSFNANNDMQKDWFELYHDTNTPGNDNRNDYNYGSVSDKVYKERLQKLPTSIEMPFNQIVKSYIERYVVKGRSLVSRLLGMSPYYMPIFEAALERHHMPLELKYIPIIESALNPNAVSPAGAGGLWQFMPSTAKGHGMEVNNTVDERRDPYTSSEKAALFFQKLYSKYGDWSLAIAAYNCGPGNVDKAIKRTGNDKADFWEIYNYLPKETRGYVPAFIAANYMMHYYKDHGISPEKTRPFVIDTVMVNKRVSFRQIASVLNIPVEEIRILNPQYRSDVIPGNVHPYVLALPNQHIYSYIKDENRIINNSRNTYDNKKDDDDDNITLATTEHEVKQGEDLYDIADMYGMQIDDLMELNKLESFYVQPGQILKVSNGAQANQSSNLAMNNANNSFDDEGFDYSDSSIKKDINYYGNNNSYNYTDGSGRDNRPVPERRKKDERQNPVPQSQRNNDSYSSNYGNNSYDNDYQSDSDEEMKRQQEEAARKKREAEAAAKKKREQEAAAKKKREQEAAAKKKREQEAAKKKAAEEAAKKKAAEEAAKKKAAEEAARKKAAEEAKKPIIHEVKEGNNLTKLAKQYGTTPEAIRKANGITGDQIKIGQKIKIPKNGHK